MSTKPTAAPQASEVFEGLKLIANAITPVTAAGANVSDGSYVASLTEALVYVGSGIHRIADTLEAARGALERDLEENRA